MKTELSFFVVRVYTALPLPFARERNYFRQVMKITKRNQKKSADPTDRVSSGNHMVPLNLNVHLDRTPLMSLRVHALKSPRELCGQIQVEAQATGMVSS